MRPEPPEPPSAEPPGVFGAIAPMAAGPTDVQFCCDTELVMSTLKMRKLTVARSATDSPRLVLGTGFWKKSDQLLSRPAFPGVLSVISSFHAPLTFLPTR